MGLTASAVVSFGTQAADNEVLAVELDSREGGMNGGKSSFEGSDKPVFLIWASVPYGYRTSKGESATVSSREITDHDADVIVALQPGTNSHEAQLDKPAVSGGVAVEYEYGSATMTMGKKLADGRYGSVIFTLPEQPAGSKDVRWLVARLRWKSHAAAVRVTPPGAWKTALPEGARIVLMISGS